MRKIIYVDCYNFEGPWDGTLQYPWQTIQQGVDAATNGDTVFVFAGYYFENVVIDVSITLVGETREHTIVSANGFSSPFTLWANGISISNFTLQDSGAGAYDSGICIPPQTLLNDITILNNIIWRNFAGIVLYSHNTTIDHNLIIDNAWNGISAGSVDHALIVNNTFNNNTNDGIHVTDSFSVHICNNTFSNSDTGIMVDAWESINNHIEIINNTIKETNISIQIMNSHNARIENNILFANNTGIACDNADNSTIANNTIRNGTRAGIWTYNSPCTVVNRNIISRCYWGIMWIGSKKSEIVNNTITQNEYGMSLHIGLMITYKPSDVTAIVSNNISENGYGLEILRPYLNVEKNNFIRNGVPATFYLSFYDSFHALGRPTRWKANYWDTTTIIQKIKGTIHLKIRLPDPFGRTVEIPWYQFDFFPSRTPYTIPPRDTPIGLI